QVGRQVGLVAPHHLVLGEPGVVGVLVVRFAGAGSATGGGAVPAAGRAGALAGGAASGAAGAGAGAGRATGARPGAEAVAPARQVGLAQDPAGWQRSAGQPSGR